MKKVLLALVAIPFASPAATICPIGDCATVTFNAVEQVGPLTPIPGGTGDFTSLVTAASIDNGVVVLNGQGAGQQGLYAYPPNPVAPAQGVRVADLHTLIPGGTGTFTAFQPSPTISGLDIAFVAGGLGQQGVYLARGVLNPGGLPIYPPVPVKVADLRTPIPRGVGNFTSFAPIASIDAGAVVFNGSGGSGQSGLYAFQNGVLSAIVSAPALLPIDSGATVASIDRFPPAPIRIGAGNLAFLAAGPVFQGVYLSAGTTGQFANIANTLTTVMPGTSLLFQAFSTVSYDGAFVAFAGTSNPADPAAFQGVYKVLPAPAGAPPSPCLPVADTSTLAPGGVANFTAFGNVAVDPGVVVFEGFSPDGLGSTIHGIYTDANGTLSKVIATGDLLNGKIVQSLSFGPGGFSDGQISYAATFTDGSFAVLTSTPSALTQPSITDPAPGAFVRGSHEFAADAPGATAVTFRVDDGPFLPATLAAGITWVLSPPFDTTTLADGPHSLTAESAQLLGTLSAMGFFISDNTKPTVGLAAIPATVRGTIAISASASDATSGVASIAITVNTTPLPACPNATTCTVSFDTTTLLNGPFTVNAVATDVAGNVSDVATATSQASNFNLASFITSPAAGAIVKTSLTVSVSIVDPGFASVQCSVGGTSLGVSSNPAFTQTVSLLNQLDGALLVSCTARDRAGNASAQSVTVTVKNWELNLHPNHLNLKSGGDKLNISVRGVNASSLLPLVSTLSLAVPGGSPIPALVAQQHVDGDEDCDDHSPGHVDVKFSRQAFIQSAQAAIASGRIDPKKDFPVQFLSGAHLIGTDNATVKP